MRLLFNPIQPSRFSQRVLLSFVSAAAALIAIYMGLYQWGLIENVWDPVFGTETEAVLKSNASHVMRQYLLIPDAILGAVSYIGDIFFALAGSSQRWYDRPWIVLLFGLYVIPPAMVSILLVIIQGTVLKSWCFLCLLTATISVGLILLSFNEVFYTLLYLRNVWKQSHDRTLLWNTLWGRPSEIAYSVAKEIEK